MATKSVSISLINNHVFVFVAIVIIGIVLISVYMMIKPEKSTPFYFSPFPTESPSSLPDPSRPTDTCWNKLTPCDSEGQCSACSLDEYHCVTVTQEQEDQKYYHFNGINVPKGKWCLPKDGNPNPVCNTFTGKWLWVYDPEYCAIVSPGHSQCWKCECKYPNLFSGSETGCNTKLACQNDSIKTKSDTQPKNQLVGSECSKSNLHGEVWDPTSNNSDTDIYNYTPYDKDKDGNPWFVCDCNDNSDGQFFSRLPHDPHTCHLEPCYSYLNSNLKGLECDKDGCQESNCECLCSGPFAKSPSGKFKNSCVLITNACGQFGYNNKEQTCECGDGPNWPRKCKNSVTGVNMDDESLPDCKEPANALGSECINPCEESKCAHKSLCVSCGSYSYKSDPICNNPQYGDPEKAHYVCDCSSATTPPKPFSGYNGQNCQYMCLADGTTIGYTDPGKSWDPGHLFECWSCSCCCSSRKEKDWDTIHIAYTLVCDTSKPGKYDSDCAPGNCVKKGTDC